MAVIKARINGRHNVTTFMNNVLHLSPDVEVVHTDATGINVELSGPTERSILSLVGLDDVKVGVPQRRVLHHDTRVLDVQGESLPVSSLSRKPLR